MVPRLMDKLALRTAIRLARSLRLPQAAPTRLAAWRWRQAFRCLKLFLSVLWLAWCQFLLSISRSKIANARHSLDAAKPVHWSSDVQFFS